MRRYDSINGNVTAIFDFEFTSPEIMEMVWKRWGPGESPEDAKIIERTWTRVD